MARSLRLDFLYPTVTEPIELVANSLSVCQILVSSRILHPDPLSVDKALPFALNPELPYHSDVLKAEPLSVTTHPQKLP